MTESSDMYNSELLVEGGQRGGGVVGLTIKSSLVGLKALPRIPRVNLN